MRRSLHDAWWRLVTAQQSSPSDHLLIGLLDGGSWLYGLGVGLRNTAYERRWIRPVALSCPVISVGNLAVGGTGKTACVEYVAGVLRQLGRRVGILSRGYGVSAVAPYWLMSRQGRLLRDGQPIDGAEDSLPDEPRMLACHLPDVPVVIGARRAQTGRLACERLQADVVLLDDGFQHRRLARQCDIVLISASMPLDGWRLLPRGPMREPLESLRRADVILITKADQSRDKLAAWCERLKTFNPEALLVTAVHEPVGVSSVGGDAVPLDRLAKGRVGLLSSIGDPEGFEQTVRQLGATVSAHAIYPDHYRYTPADWSAILEAASASTVDAVVTTEKDLVRLRPLLDDGRALQVPVWVLRVRMRLLTGEDALHARLKSVCGR